MREASISHVTPPNNGPPDVAGSSSVDLCVRRLGEKEMALPRFGVRFQGVVE